LTHLEIIQTFASLKITKQPNQRNMNLFQIVIVLFLFSFQNHSFSQSSRNYYKVYVPSARSSEKALSIDQFMRNQSGILTSRMDKQTGIYLCIYNPSIINLDQIETWLISLGFTPECVVTGIHGNGEIIKTLRRSDCLISDQNLETE